MMTNVNINDSLVSVQWLAENLQAENLVILDASMPPVTAADNSKVKSASEQGYNGVQLHIIYPVPDTLELPGRPFDGPLPEVSRKL